MTVVTAPIFHVPLMPPIKPIAEVRELVPLTEKLEDGVKLKPPVPLKEIAAPGTLE
jgi:hypothetical protein